LVVQRAYLDQHGCLPIENEIDVISVGTSFLRFLEIAEALDKPVAVVTDTDWSLEALENKYKDYLDDNQKENITICYDPEMDEGDLQIGDKPFNYNTLEPKLLKANDRDTLNTIFGTDYESDDDLLKYMKGNKTDCALKIFNAEQNITYPEYIMKSFE
jgi:putative ATP-dependent endonuclease of OLD family